MERRGNLPAGNQRARFHTWGMYVLSASLAAGYPAELSLRMRHAEPPALASSTGFPQPIEMLPGPSRCDFVTPLSPIAIPPEHTAFMKRNYDGRATLLDWPAVRESGDIRLLLPVVDAQVPRENAETEQARADRVVAVARRLADLRWAPTKDNIRDSIGAISNARERYGSLPIFNPTVLYFAGSETVSATNNRSVFRQSRFTNRLERLATVRYFDGILPEKVNCEWATRASLQEAWNQFLDAIATTETPITVYIGAHGNGTGIELGLYRPSLSEGLSSHQSSGEDLAQAFARRARFLEERGLSHNVPDWVIFDNCFTWQLAKEKFIGGLEAKPDPQLQPFVITSAEQEQFSFRGTLLERLLNNSEGEAPTLSVLLSGSTLLGKSTWNSNLTVTARDRRGRPLQIQ
jgi:hypothetical protein